MRGQRQQILSKIRKALQVPAPMPFKDIKDSSKDVFVPLDNKKLLIEHFAANFTKLGGKFVYCANEQELLEQLVAFNDVYNLKHIHCNDYALTRFLDVQNMLPIKTGEQFHELEASITGCSNLVARTGSVVLTSTDPGGRILSVYAPIHICIAYSNQLVWNINEAFDPFKTQQQLPSMINLATGPSRTADIEKTLVVGVHGPKEVFVFYIDKEKPL